MIPFIISVIEDPDDRDYMEQLYIKHRKLMYSVINDYASYSDADDILQTVLEKLINKIELLRTLDRYTLINYISTTCRNTAKNYVNSGARKRELYVDIDDADACSSRFFSASFNDLAIMLPAVWEKLDPRHRELLEMKYIMGFEDGEIAERLGISASSVRTYVSRA